MKKMSYAAMQHITGDVLFYKINRFYYKNGLVLCTKPLFYYTIIYIIFSIVKNLTKRKGEHHAIHTFFDQDQYDRLSYRAS